MKVNYPVLVLAENQNGRQTTLRRTGGGCQDYPNSDRYYPTILWFEEGMSYRRYFDPSEQTDKWRGAGPDRNGPWIVVKVLETHTSDDPLSATVRGFAPARILPANHDGTPFDPVREIDQRI